MLYQATRFAVSPDLRWLVTDPGYSHTRFWFGRPGGAGHYRTPTLAAGCVVAQYAWFPDSSAVAYMDMCTAAGPSPYRFVLYRLPLSGSGRKLLDIKSKRSDGMEIGPSSRCLTSPACRGG
jgi:hypothetical protein